MTSVGPQLGAIAPHIRFARWRTATWHNGRPSSRPSIVKECAGELNVVQLAQAGLVRICKVKCMRTGDAFKGDAYAAQEV